MNATIVLVEDDAAVRDALTQLLEGEGYRVESYATAQECLAGLRPERTGCLLLDLALPDQNGLELHEALRRGGIEVPTIFLTAHGDVPASVRALKAGALDFLEKPARKDVLVKRVREAMRASRVLKRESAQRAQARDRLGSLTAREREVLPMVAGGRTSKDIARELGISHRTVELHRARIMQKTGAATLVELARLLDAARRRS